MNRYLPIIGFLVAISLTIGACIIDKRTTRSDPIQTTCSEIYAEPAKYVGSRVMVPTNGTEVMEGQLIWRKFTPGEPHIVFYFATRKIPNPLPSHIVGDCVSPVRGGPIRIINCR